MDNRRLLLLFVFSFSVFVLWDAWQKYNQPPAPPATEAAVAAPSSAQVPGTPAATGAAVGSAAVPTLPATARAATAPASVAALGRSSTGVSRRTAWRLSAQSCSRAAISAASDVSTQGGDLVSLELNNYKALKNKAEQFKLFEGKHQYVAQSGLIGDGLPNHKTLFVAKAGARELAGDAKSVQLRLEAPAHDGVKVAKVYTFTRGSYLIDVSYEIENGGQKELAPYAYYQLQRDTAAPEGESSMVSTYTGPAVFTEQEKFQKISFSDIEKGKAKFNAKADNGWVAMIQHYFVSAWIPQEKLAREYYTRKIDGTTPAVAAGVVVPTPAVAPGATAKQTVHLYAGPQIQSALEQLAKPAANGGIGAVGLPLVVDYGWLTIVAAPIFWCLELIHKMVGNWGWAIVLLTIGIKLLFFPLSAASYKSMAKMKAITPRLQALR